MGSPLFPCPLKYTTTVQPSSTRAATRATAASHACRTAAARRHHRGQVRTTVAARHTARTARNQTRGTTSGRRARGWRVTHACTRAFFNLGPGGVQQDVHGVAKAGQQLRHPLCVRLARREVSEARVLVPAHSYNKRQSAASQLHSPRVGGEGGIAWLYLSTWNRAEPRPTRTPWCTDTLGLSHAPASSTYFGCEPLLP
jgi:hypothetical protein